MNLNVDDLTLGELEDIEERTGVNVATLRGGGPPPSKVLTALVWVMKRREDPSFTYEQARELKVTELVGEVPSPNE